MLLSALKTQLGLKPAENEQLPIQHSTRDMNKHLDMQYCYCHIQHKTTHARHMLLYLQNLVYSTVHME